MVDEFGNALFRELDYRREADNAALFKALYGGDGCVVVPDIFFDFTSRRVLTMEWIHGVKVGRGGKCGVDGGWLYMKEQKEQGARNEEQKLLHPQATKGDI